MPNGTDWSMIAGSRAGATARDFSSTARKLRLVAAGLAMLAPALAPGQASPGAAPPAVRDLGGDRYQIGTIVVDRKARQLVVPGRVIHIDDAPLEYVAVGRAGAKAYESLLELDAIGTEFNVGCLLLGLDATSVRRPEFQFDRRPPDGPAVELELRWTVDDKTVQVPMREALRVASAPEPGAPAVAPEDDWVYTGSFSAGPEGRYAADVVGAIVGFVHDPASIIEHRAGLGIGAYGSVQGNRELLPPVGSLVELIVTVPRGRE